MCAWVDREKLTCMKFTRDGSSCQFHLQVLDRRRALLFVTFLTRLFLGHGTLKDFVSQPLSIRTEMELKGNPNGRVAF